MNCAPFAQLVFVPFFGDIFKTVAGLNNGGPFLGAFFFHRILPRSQNFAGEAGDFTCFGQSHFQVNTKTAPDELGVKKSLFISGLHSLLCGIMGIFGVFLEVRAGIEPA